MLLRSQMRLEHRVREAQVEDLAETHDAEEVVDPIELVLADELVDFRRKVPSGGEIVAEWLLHHHPSPLR